MSNLKEVAKKLRVNKETLGFRLWRDGIQPSSYEQRGGKFIKQYDAAAIKRIRQYLKHDPIRKGRGRPKVGGKAKR